jgi:hypothetical protein
MKVFVGPSWPHLIWKRCRAADCKHLEALPRRLTASIWAALRGSRDAGYCCTVQSSDS